jgi:hypothetical protein
MGWVCFFICRRACKGPRLALFFAKEREKTGEMEDISHDMRILAPIFAVFDNF